MRVFKSSKGFTLLEILIVLVILAVLAGLAIPTYMTSVEKSRKQEAITVLGTIRQSQQRFFATQGTYATSYAQLDFDPTVAMAGNTPHFTYAAPVVAGATYTVTATRNAVDFSVGPAGYTVQINHLGAITSTY